MERSTWNWKCEPGEHQPEKETLPSSDAGLRRTAHPWNGVDLHPPMDKTKLFRMMVGPDGRRLPYPEIEDIWEKLERFKFEHSELELIARHVEKLIKEKKAIA